MYNNLLKYTQWRFNEPGCPIFRSPSSVACHFSIGPTGVIIVELMNDTWHVERTVEGFLVFRAKAHVLHQ